MDGLSVCVMLFVCRKCWYSFFASGLQDFISVWLT